MIEELKIHPAEFAAVVSGKKTWEFRYNDRCFRVGDVLRLRAWDPKTRKYTGDEVYRKVTYLIEGPAFEIPRGFVVMSIAERGKKDA